MAIFLSSISAHDWTLTVIAVCVVFLCLLILFAVYSLLGLFWSGKAVRRQLSKSSAANPDEETAAAIMIALKLYNSDFSHDTESGVITIKTTARAPRWTDSRAKLDRR